MRNEHLGEIEAKINTDTGEVSLTIWDIEEENKLLEKSMKLSHNNKSEDMIVRFTFENHPETQRNEKFKGIVYSKGWRNYYLLIYPQFGPGSITNQTLILHTEGNNAFFSS